MFIQTTIVIALRAARQEGVAGLKSAGKEETKIAAEQRAAGRGRRPDAGLRPAEKNAREPEKIGARFNLSFIG